MPLSRQTAADPDRPTGPAPRPPAPAGEARSGEARSGEARSGGARSGGARSGGGRRDGAPPGEARARLRRATAAAHAALEAHPRLAVLDADRPDVGPNPGPDPAGYADLLTCFAGWYRPMEAALAAAPPGVLPPDADARWKAPLLAADLAALGRPATEGPLCGALPPVADGPAALGALYVMEGATLGGALLAARLLAAPPEAPAGRLPVAFFSSYGAERGLRWRSFLDHLERRLDSPARRERAAEAACLTFASLARWLDDAPAA